MSSYHLAELAEGTAARLGDYDALWFDGRTFRSHELLDRARRLAGGLRRRGVQPGDRVAVLMANCPEVTVTYHAVWRAGAVVTPVVFLVTASELRHILVDSGATVLVTTSEFLPKVAEAAAGLTDLRTVVVVGRGSWPGEQQLADFEELATAPRADVVPRADDDLAALMYTGGTTGRAKGVMLSHRNLWSCAAASSEISYVPGMSRLLNPLPVSHAFGLIVTVIGLHSPEPGFAVLMRWFDPDGWVALAERHRVHRSTIVPAMAQMLLAKPLEDADLTALRYLSVGAAPLAVETIAEIERRLPGVEVLEGYGCTESGAVISTNPPGERRVGTVGRPLPGYQVRIVDDAGQELPAGADGEITVRGPGVMAGYWKAPAATETALRGGWLHTGDIGHLDADGFLSVVDRKKDLVIRGGFNVFPRDVEDVLVRHPAVAMAGVVGRPDERLGEEVVAYVSLRPGAQVTPAELIEFARAQLAPTKYPREVHLLDALPLTSVGKLDRKLLRARAASQR
jgi:long-chain acyl-CoA synthetase